MAFITLHHLSFTCFTTGAVHTDVCHFWTTMVKSEHAHTIKGVWLHIGRGCRVVDPAMDMPNANVNSTDITVMRFRAL